MAPRMLPTPPQPESRAYRQRRPPGILTESVSVLCRSCCCRSGQRTAAPCSLRLLKGFFDCLDQLRHIIAAQVIGFDLHLVAAFCLYLMLQRPPTLTLFSDTTHTIG